MGLGSCDGCRLLLAWESFEVFLFIDCAKKIGILSNRDVEMLRNKKFVVFPGDWAPWGRRGLTAVVGFGFRSLLGLLWIVPESKFVC